MSADPDVEKSELIPKAVDAWASRRWQSVVELLELRLQAGPLQDWPLVLLAELLHAPWVV
jgi:hypothetical protein